MADVIYPSNAELNEIAQDLMPRLQADRPTFAFFPIVQQDAWLLLWEQMDNFIGLQYARGLNGQPTRIRKTGAKRYSMQPGVYGEYEYIDEEELTARRQYGTFNIPVNIDDLVAIANTKLLQRELDRIESIIWTLLTTATFSVFGPTGALTHTDTFTMQTFTATTPWSDHANSTPLGDLRTLALLGLGHSVTFDNSSQLWINRKTANNVVANTNPSDLGSRRFGFSTINNINDVNQLLTLDGLPNFSVYEGAYYDDTNTLLRFIPDNTGVLIGKRPAGQVLGQYRLVRNANNDGFAAGSYSRIVDNVDDGPPRSIAVHRGHNGGPVIFFGTAVVRVNV
jgi:hypothetical protein